MYSEERERRKYLRHAFAYTVLCRCQGEQDWNKAIGYNISLGGVSFYSEIYYNQNDILEVKLFHPEVEDKSDIIHMTSVIWITNSKIKNQKYLLGSEFKNQTGGHKTHIKDIIRECIKES